MDFSIILHYLSLLDFDLIEALAQNKIYFFQILIRLQKGSMGEILNKNLNSCYLRQTLVKTGFFNRVKYKNLPDFRQLLTFSLDQQQINKATTNSTPTNNHIFNSK